MLNGIMWKWTKRILLGLVGLIVVAVGTLEGQCACYTADPQGPYYDAATVETLTGEIVAVDRVTAKRRGWGEGVHAELATPAGPWHVHLGPAASLHNRGKSRLSQSP